MKFFDLQVNGYAGIDFQQPDLCARDLLGAVREMNARAPTQFLFTLITDSVASLRSKLRRVEQLCREEPELNESLVGYHLEGPYLCSKEGFHGPHPRQFMKDPEIAEFDALQEAANGRIRLFTLAPERPGSMEFIRHLTSGNVVCAIGHSDASTREIDEAIEAGLKLCTHLGNAIPIQMHRHDNVLQRLLARDELFAAFIPDGLHLPPNVLKNLVRAKPVDKVLFTTDCMAAAAAPPGRYSLGDTELDCGDDGVVRDPGKANFAGSSLTMSEAYRNVRSFLGWSHSAALHACDHAVRNLLMPENPPQNGD